MEAKYVGAKFIVTKQGGKFKTGITNKNTPNIIIGKYIITPLHLSDYAMTTPLTIKEPKQYH